MDPKSDGVRTYALQQELQAWKLPGASVTLNVQGVGTRRTQGLSYLDL